ncbi:hypothetical protein BDV26DRAFT_285021 [Aspergillus bertholletiae]|uniref:Uncharacterized protein n=1 Tax=Aspergillus bertholletiae TaxID=1226010 RepID=A0A5N7AUM1_9EURO|nr:hypothetical protein BDV26DRAFT_285021 [Aspergillus bertholletiae]
MLQSLFPIHTRISLWMQLVRFIHTYESPLCLRGSLIRLSHRHRHPFLALLYLFRARDTPLRSLYRIYEAMAARQYTAIPAEVEYFWHQVRRSWAVHRIPDPNDSDPIRYAILASIAEELADAFNWRLGLELRRDITKNIYHESFDDELPPFVPDGAPCWTSSLPAVDYHLIEDLPDNLRDSSDKLVLEEGGENANFAKRNIVTNSGFFRTV